MKKIIIIMFGMGLFFSSTVDANIKNLQRFFKKVKTFQAQFIQVVEDEGMNRLQESSGTMWIERPGRFRWNYDAPLKQQIVSDGKKLWVYDIELEQVVVRKMHGSLGQTPAILLAGRAALSKNFALETLDNEGKLQWVKLIPKNKDGGYQDIRIGFENGKIRSLLMIDGFGRRTRITLYKTRENMPIKRSVFRFKIPPKVDVIGQ